MSENKENLLAKLAELEQEEMNGVSLSRKAEIDGIRKMYKDQLTAIETQELQEQAAQVRIQDATEQAAYFLDNLVIEGLTMRELCVDEPQYQMLRIAVQNKIINLAEDASKQISELQAEETAQQNALKKRIEEFQAKADQESREAFEDHETIKQLRVDLSQARSEVADYQGKLKNATDEIERLNSHVDDLRKEIAVGARNAYKVTDVDQSEQLKQLADQIKAARIHVYDVQALDTNRANFTAINAKTGETVTYNWTTSKNYIEITDPNEVEQFRNQHANQSVVSDPALDESIQDSVTPEETFPELPSAIPPEVPAIPVAVVEGPSSDNGQGQTVEERVAALEKRVVELEKVCNLNEESDTQAVA